ncbi:hypothetical protein G6011_03481 [Alternaria panax]|uniref:Uncharacterized protein n=1 Tax=Alternaria panax TaxID=48097 RepID=A0AAD4NR46_9PLEO|nr:hypothetical protein G6011_03481 [Alternaria panax]
MPTLDSTLPTARLFVPESLHWADLPTAAPTETEGTRLKYFQRKIGRPKLESRNFEDRRPSTTIPRETPDDLSRDFPAIRTTYHFADYVLSSEKASSDTLAFVSIIQQVRQDIDEATRLYLSSAVSNFLDAYPSKRRWIEGSLLEVRSALNDIGMDMDTAWGHDGDGGTVASKRKLEWGLKNQKKLLKKRQQLDQCHTQLTGAIYVMQTAELCGKPGVIAEDPIFEAPVRPWVPHDERDALRGPYSRQKYRTASHTNLFGSNVSLVAEVEKDNVETSSINSVPVELAGSTPADLDLAESQNLQAFLSPRMSREFHTESSALHRRPRARTDNSRQSATRESGSRASIDVATSFSKVADTSIERNDSTLSTQATVSVPMVARRYRATSIDIQRHTEKHRSLPSELPYLKSQPSLIDDLAGYVLPSAASDRLPSREWAASPTLSVPSISLTSSPTIGHALPVVPETTSILDAGTSGLPSPATEAAEAQLAFGQLVTSNVGTIKYPQHENRDVSTSSTRMEASSPRRISSDSAEHATLPSSYYATSVHTLRSPSSLFNVTVVTDDEPICRPSSQRPSQRISKRMSQTSSRRSFNAAPSPTIATVTQTPAAPTNPGELSHQDAAPSAVAPLSSPRIITEDASQPMPVDPTEIPEELDDEEVMLSVLQQRLRSCKRIKTMAEDLVRQASAAEATHQATNTERAILSPPVWQEQQTSASRPDVQVDIAHTVSSATVELAASPVASSGSQDIDEEKKLMSAQAKRRAAHARRMQLAFGDGSTA